jgi:2,3-bisphosphoglycerate-independent phosphoglycerate mutase
MSVLGCDLPTEYSGRGPLEAAGRGLPLKPDDTAFRINLITTENGILRDFSGGHVAPADAAELIAALQQHLGGPGLRFHPGVSYRNLLLLSGVSYGPHVKTEKPDDNHGERVADHLPRALGPEGEETAQVLRRVIVEARAVLEQHPVNRRLVSEGKPPVNGIWPWSGGRVGALRKLQDVYGVRGAVISAVDVITGLGRCLGMDVISVPGATGYTDTNYEGKAQAAIEALKTYDFVYLHLEAIDEVSHEQNLEKKLRTIEDFDARIITPVLDAVGPAVNAAVLPDHPVPIALGKHTRTPVPVSVRMVGATPDAVSCYNEIDCPRGSLGALRGDGLMRLLFG